MGLMAMVEVFNTSFSQKLEIPYYSNTYLLAIWFTWAPVKCLEKLCNTGF